MPHCILIVEESPVLSSELTIDSYLETAPDASTALVRLEREQVDAILIDDSVAEHEVCAHLRYAGIQLPIIIVSSRVKSEDKIRGLYSGADDYVTKPFDSAELSARIHALRRRTSSNETLTEYHFANIRVNFVTGAAYKNGVPLNLSVKELRLLRFLIARRHSVVSREELLHHVWGYRAHDTRTIDVHVAAVRRKLEDDPQHPHFILTERGKGYRFQDAKCKELLTEHSETLL